MSLNLQTIKIEDTIQDSVNKCNDNFAEIIRNGGGPKGDDGNDGEVGATGKSGNKIWINDSSDSDFDSHLEDDEYQDGDLIFFKNYSIIGDVEVNATTLEKEFKNGTSIRGEQGIQGIQGNNATDHFSVQNRYLFLNRSDYNGVFLPSINPGSYNVNNLLAIDCNDGKGLSFLINGNERSVLKNDSTTFINRTELNYLIETTMGNLNLVSNGFIKNTASSEIVSSSITEILSSVGTNSIDINQTNIVISGDEKVDGDIDNTGYSISTKDITCSNSINSKTITVSDSITTPSIQPVSTSLIVGKNGSTIDMRCSSMSISANDISIGDNIEISSGIIRGKNGSNLNISSEVKASVNGGSVYLGVPKFSIVLVPVNFTLSTGSHFFKWENNIVLTTSGNMVNTTYSMHDYKYVRYIDSNNNSYLREITKIADFEPTVDFSGNTDIYGGAGYIGDFVKYVLFNGFEDIREVPANAIFAEGLVPATPSSSAYTKYTLTIEKPTAPSGFVWIVKYE